MKVLIIEDEALTAEDLRSYVLALRPQWEVAAVLSSVREAKEWFASHPQPDLLFSDIQLGDGQCFDIYAAHPPTAPVIFCTAFDDYALQAFQANGIAYVLKPFGQRDIAAALDKLDRLTQPTSAQLQSLLTTQQPQPQPFLVSYRDRIIPIAPHEVALFYIRHELTHLRTLDNRDFVIPHTLEELERLAGPAFFRAGRQSLVHRAAIREAAHHSGRRLLLSLSIPFDGEITVSKEKVGVFLEWMRG
jgi:DNA-binding LytR/AlgR family response regulator